MTSSFAAIQVQVDRDDIMMDETLTLVLSSKDHLRINPDLVPLKKDFYIVGTSQNSQFNLINGVTQMETQWKIALLPKHPGDILLPSIQVGSEKTEPQLIHVAATKKNITPQKVARDQAIFIETSVVPKETYIQEQFVYTLKLFFSRSIENPYLLPPDLPDAKITQNGQDIIYTTVKNGKYYRVLERSYLITPKNTGHYQIQPPVLKGYIEGSMGTMDIYGISTSSLHPIKIVGPILDINVKPKPANFAGHWLPAKKLTVSDAWEPNPPVFREGEPVTRIIEIKAEGTTADQIPNLSIASSPNLNSYLQQPTRETEVNEQVQVGKLQQKIVFIPTSSGRVVIPAIKVRWWNSQTQKEQVETIPQKTVTVLPPLIKSSAQPVETSASRSFASLRMTPASQGMTPASQGMKSTSQGMTPASKGMTPAGGVKSASGGLTPASSETINQGASSKIKNYFWPILAMIFIFMWLVTLWMWRRQVTFSSTGYFNLRRSPNIVNIQNLLKAACFTNNARQTRRVFLEWARTFWKNPELHSLPDVVHVLKADNAKQLINEIMQLEASFYSKSKKNWEGISFWQTFQNYLKIKEAGNPANNEDLLPPLYCSTPES